MLYEINQINLTPTYSGFKRYLTFLPKPLTSKQRVAGAFIISFLIKDNLIHIAKIIIQPSATNKNH